MLPLIPLASSFSSSNGIDSLSLSQSTLSSASVTASTDSFSTKPNRIPIIIGALFGALVGILLCGILIVKLKRRQAQRQRSESRTRASHFPFTPCAQNRSAIGIWDGNGSNRAGTGTGSGDVCLPPDECPLEAGEVGRSITTWSEYYPRDEKLPIPSFTSASFPSPSSPLCEDSEHAPGALESPNSVEPRSPILLRPPTSPITDAYAESDTASLTELEAQLEIQAHAQAQVQTKLDRFTFRLSAHDQAQPFGDMHMSLGTSTWPATNATDSDLDLGLGTITSVEEAREEIVRLRTEIVRLRDSQVSMEMVGMARGLDEMSLSMPPPSYSPKGNASRSGSSGGSAE
jgi:hypothetical protein